VGDPAPPIYVVALSNSPITLDRYAGQLLLLHFWEARCSICQEEIPLLVEVYEEFHDQGLEILSIALDRHYRRQDLLEFVRSHGMRWEHLNDGLRFDSPLARKYAVAALPITMLIGRDGRICAINSPYPDIGSIIRTALKGEPA
jgi:peroxiredoxin